MKTITSSAEAREYWAKEPVVFEVACPGHGQSAMFLSAADKALAVRLDYPTMLLPFAYNYETGAMIIAFTDNSDAVGFKDAYAKLLD